MISANTQTARNHPIRNNLLLSIIIPTLNEFNNLKFLIPQIVRELEVIEELKHSYEIIVVDDLSEDKTAKLIQRLKKDAQIRFFPSRKQRGLARSAIQGFKVANGMILVLMDGDGSHDPRYLKSIVNPILTGKAYVTVGSRYIKGGSIRNWSLKRKLISKFAAALTKPLTGLHDSNSGFLAFRKDRVEVSQIKPRSWKIALEICAKFPLRIYEIPISFEDRKFGESKLNIKSSAAFFAHLFTLYFHRIKKLFKLS